MSNLLDIPVRIEGESSLLMHSVRAADPMDPMAKKMKSISSKRKKTDEDHLDLAKLDFEAGMYMDEELGPYIPAENIERCFRDGGSITKNGKNIVRGVIVLDERVPLQYEGPRALKALWDKGYWHKSMVRVGQNRVPRVRPKFDNWEAEFMVRLNTEILDPDVFKEIVETSGAAVGLGDWRPRFGRFTAEVDV